jgi:hypothetical protein
VIARGYFLITLERLRVFLKFGKKFSRPATLRIRLLICHFQSSHDPLARMAASQFTGQSSVAVSPPCWASSGGGSSAWSVFSDIMCIFCMVVPLKRE